MYKRILSIALTGILLYAGFVIVAKSEGADEGYTLFYAQYREEDESLDEHLVDQGVKDTVIRDQLLEKERKRIQKKEQKKREADLAEQMRQQKEEELKTDTYYQKYLSKKQENEDTVGWLKISDMSISYPVMCTVDDFYLDHNSDKQLDSNGAIYLGKSEWGHVNLVNGHNMKSGKMFGLLDYFKNERYCKEHQYITVAREGDVVTYRVFSVFLTDTATEALSFSEERDGEELKSFIKTLGNRSMFHLDYDGDADDILILNTCSYEYSEAHLLVCAYKISEGKE